MAYGVLQYEVEGAQVEPFEIGEDDMPPIGLDTYAWDCFRGTRVEEDGSISRDEYYGQFDSDAVEIFVMMLAHHMKKGRITLWIEYEDQVDFGFIVEPQAAVAFDSDWKNVSYHLAPKGRALKRRIIYEAIEHYRSEIERLQEMEKKMNLSEEEAA